MDIFGIGAAELIIVALLTLIVAGPKRSAEWARQAGVWLGQLRDLWQRMMADLREEIGDDADEILKTAEEFSRTTNDFRQQTSVRNLAGRAMNMAESSARKKPTSSAEPTAASQNGTDNSDRYNAWVIDSTQDTEASSESDKA